MKKRFLSAFAALMLAFSAMPAGAAAERADYCSTVAADGFNTELLSGTVIVADSAEYTKSAAYAVVVDRNGRVVSAGDITGGADIPAGGFAVCTGKDKKSLISFAAEGDLAYYSASAGSVTFATEGYTPFGSTELAYDAVNAARAENTLIIYRGSKATGTNVWGYEVCVDAEGNVVSVGGNNNDIPEGGFVLSAVGTKKQPLTDAAAVGMKVMLDEQEKTVTISFDKANAAEYYNVQSEKALAVYNAMLASCADFDTDTSAACAERLVALCGGISDSLKDKTLVRFLSLADEFKTVCARMDVACMESVAVETRSLWLRIPTVRTASTVKSVVDAVEAAGFNQVCIEGLFDSTTIMPMPEDSLYEQNPVYRGTDMLRLYTDEFHSRGIEVVLWMSCLRAGYEGSGNTARGVAAKKPEWRAASQSGKDTVSNEYGNAYFLNPALPEVKEFLLSNYRYILENYDIDGFQLDYIRYPENSSENYGYDEYTVSEFKRTTGASEAPKSSGQPGWSEWCDFRASKVTDIVSAVSALVREIRPDILFSADVAPEYPSSRVKMCQDTLEWISKGYVDAVYPMAYGTTDAVRKWTGMTNDALGEGQYSVIGLRDNGAEVFTQQVLAARALGADGIAFFSYGQYIAGDYSGVVENGVFAHKALSPTYNAKAAAAAELEHIANGIKLYMSRNELADETGAYSGHKLRVETLINENIPAVISAIEANGAEAEKEAFAKIIDECGEIASECRDSGGTYFAVIGEYIASRVPVLQKIFDNAADDAKKAFAEALAAKRAAEEESKADASSEGASAESDAGTGDEKYKPNGFERAVQVIGTVIMATGVFGLPAYFILNARRKRIAKGNAQGGKPDSGDENAENGEDTQKTDENTQKTDGAEEKEE